MLILLVDDEEKCRGVLAKVLTAFGHQVTECSDGLAAINLVKSQKVDLILSDIRMPRMSGLDLLKNIHALPANQKVAVILITAFGDMQTAIEALRLGAFDYLLKPIDFDDLVTRIERVAEHLNIQGWEIFAGQGTEASPDALGMPAHGKSSAKNVFQGFDIFFSKRMTPLIEQVRMLYLDRTLPVLIQGETGTGKEVIARLIHFGDDGSSAPFIDLNCAALSPHVFESELFGYEAGAFTGCLPKGQKGKLDLASGGTIFLDEIAEMPAELQAKLLRVLQEKEYYRVGGLKKIKADVRVICATNAEIEEKVEQGTFRRDLFYRLNAARIYLPPLRERKDEIVSLAMLFLTKSSKQKGKGFRGISLEAVDMLRAYEWPGNVRELKNIVEYTVAMYNDTELKAVHLDPFFKNAAKNKGKIGQMEHESLSTYTNKIILEALDMHNGNRTETARYLKIPLSTFYRKLKNLNKTR
jgi:two-component system response regulator AtoC